MRNTFTIFDDQLDSYEGKKGKIVQRVLTLVDATSNGPKMKQMCDLTVPETFMPLAGQSQGTPITVDITEISIFSGRPRLRGVVVAKGALPPVKP